ncbi:uncharacterized protein FTOL_09446 [Fusarium torulosum]|uniref:Uncharacterized protein n=1 Tax=Fusarium torulosum TaxID=33205 RepID=A0AAE8SL31_9HYPO|nr:uncharacterized protein FTOL_09446 [Fusarium torulosum]
MSDKLKVGSSCGIPDIAAVTFADWKYRVWTDVDPCTTHFVSNSTYSTVSTISCEEAVTEPAMANMAHKSETREKRKHPSLAQQC